MMKYRITVTWKKMSIWRKIKAIYNFSISMLFDKQWNKWAGDAETVDVDTIKR